MADNEQASSEPKSSESTTGIVLALIFFFPLGLYWMWKYPNWPTGNKWAVTGGIAVLALIGALTDDGEQAEPQEGDVTTTVSTKPAVKDTPVQQVRLNEAISTRFFSVRPGYDYIYESSRGIPGFGDGIKGQQIRRHNSDGTVATETRKVHYRVSQGSLEMVIGVGRDNGPNIWGRLIPNPVKEGDRWQVKNGGSTTTSWVCKRLSQWKHPPDQFAEYADNALVEISMEKSVDGMDGPFAAYSYTFVEELGLVSFKYYVPTSDSAKGQVSLILTERLIRIVASPST